ncbi:MAG: hypothetical protein OEL89_04730 [Candidatus Peregrinibacteria bacterium]|nr:hypothetical protein [Candidatus Peregrinibacteria bacterium]
MKYAEVIHDSWEMTQSASKLKWFAFVPAAVAVLVFVAEVIWQMYWYSEEFGFVGEHVSVFAAIGKFINFLVEHNLILLAVFFLIFVLLFVFVLPAWIQSTMILGVRHKFEKPEKYMSIRQKMIHGFDHFFKLFELNAILAPFQFLTIMFFLLTFFRIFHDSLFKLLSPIIIVYIICAFFINMFFSFAPFFIVCKKEPLGLAIRRSIGLVFLNFGRTFAVILLMLLVNVRIIVNVLVILGVPFGLLIAITYFASSAWLGLAIFVSVIIGIVAIGFASYLTAIIEVFSVAVWERTYTTLVEEQDELADKETDNEEFDQFDEQA